MRVEASKVLAQTSIRSPYTYAPHKQCFVWGYQFGEEYRDALWEKTKKDIMPMSYFIDVTSGKPTQDAVDELNEIVDEFSKDLREQFEDREQAISILTEGYLAYTAEGLDEGHIINDAEQHGTDSGGDIAKEALRTKKQVTCPECGYTFMHDLDTQHPKFNVPMFPPSTHMECPQCGAAFNVSSPEYEGPDGPEFLHDR